MPQNERTSLALRTFVFLSSFTVSAILVGILVVAPPASARNGGINNYSGAGDDFDGTGETCEACHDDPGPYSPAVAISGPDEVVVGTTNDYTITLANLLIPNPFRGGFNLAIEEGELDSDDGGVDVDEGELVHDIGRTFGGGTEVSWDFEWTAPDEPGDYTMYAAGLAGGGTGGNNDDNEATTRFTITVVAPSFLRGDVDGDGKVSAVLDASALLEWGFLDGEDPACLDSADTDNDGLLTPAVDAIFLLMYGLGDGDAPPTPGPDDCGREGRRRYRRDRLRGANLRPVKGAVKPRVSTSFLSQRRNDSRRGHATPDAPEASTDAYRPRRN